MKIVIITDGNNALGLGHIYQSLTLADALKEKEIENLSINFLTKSSQNICDFIRSRGYAVEQFENDDLIFEKLRQHQPERVIFDKLDVSPELARKINEILRIKLIIFTNLTEANQYADMTVLADMGSNFKNIVEKDRVTGRVGFVGPKFWILRPEFYALKKKVKGYNNNVKKLMLIFGGSDPSNLSSLVLKELLQIDSEYNILLVLGSGFEHDELLNEVINSHKSTRSKVTIVKNINNVGAEMHKSDVVLASPGLSFFEALAVGAPVLGFHQNELQRQVYAENLPTMGVVDMPQLADIMQNKHFIFPTAPWIQAMQIGEGKSEIINEILN
jgi:spore coat polysaccharide biosynthesis predicted glycosyltransferase SpsG